MTGPQPLRWNRTGIVIENLGNRQYHIRVDGSRRLILRNRKNLKKIKPLDVKESTKSKIPNYDDIPKAPASLKKPSTPKVTTPYTKPSTPQQNIPAFRESRGTTYDDGTGNTLQDKSPAGNTLHDKSPNNHDMDTPVASTPINDDSWNNRRNATRPTPTPIYPFTAPTPSRTRESVPRRIIVRERDEPKETDQPEVEDKEPFESGPGKRTRRKPAKYNDYTDDY